MMKNKEEYGDIGTVIKGMNYTLPTFKLEEGNVVRGLNVTLKFFNQSMDDTIRQQGIDPRTLITVLSTYFNELEDEAGEFEGVSLLLQDIEDTLKDKDLTTKTITKRDV